MESLLYTFIYYRFVFVPRWKNMVAENESRAHVKRKEKRIQSNLKQVPLPWGIRLSSINSTTNAIFIRITEYALKTTETGINNVILNSKKRKPSLVPHIPCTRFHIYATFYRLLSKP